MGASAVRGTAVPRYFVSTVTNLAFVVGSRRPPTVIATYATPDAAFFAIGDLAKKSLSSYCVWSVEDGGARRVRAYAHKGRVAWAVECRKCDGRGIIGSDSCYQCHGLGAVTG